MNVEHVAASTPDRPGCGDPEPRRRRGRRPGRVAGRDGSCACGARSLSRVPPPAGTDEFSGRRTRRTGGLVARSPTAATWSCIRSMLDAVRIVLGHVASFQLHLTQVIAIGPGEPAQLIHRDQWAFDFFPFPKGYEVAVQHDLGDDRLHRGERRDAGHPGQQPASTTGCSSPRRHGAGGDGEGLGALLHRQPLPRRRREPLGRRRATASTSPTTARGCARRRTSISRCRSTSRARCRSTCCG